MKLNLETANSLKDILNKYSAQTLELQKQIAETRSIESFCSTFLKYMEKDWPIHLLHLIEKERKLIALLKERQDLPFNIEEAEKDAKESLMTAMRRFPLMIEESCKKNNLKIDSTSRHPKYTFHDGFFTLEIDDKKFKAKFSNTEGNLFDISADIDAIIELVIKEKDRIFGRKFEGSKFLKLLRANYLAILKKDNLKDGESLPIRHITRRLGKNLKDFRSDEFSYDLSRLASEGPFEIDKRKIDLQQTKDTRQGMLLHGSISRGYIGFIIFKEVQ
jgi:hypothetical protein